MTRAFEWYSNGSNVFFFFLDVSIQCDWGDLCLYYVQWYSWSCVCVKIGCERWKMRLDSCEQLSSGVSLLIYPWNGHELSDWMIYAMSYDNVYCQHFKIIWSNIYCMYMGIQWHAWMWIKYLIYDLKRLFFFSIIIKSMLEIKRTPHEWYIKHKIL